MKLLSSIKALLSLGIIVVLGNFSSIAWADVPSEYYPNYQIADSYESLLSLFVEVEAISSIGEDIPANLFSEMNQVFGRVFPYLPQTSSNQVIYRQCELLTQELRSGVNSLKYLKFKDRCFTPLGGIIEQVNNKSTVRARATAKPTAGSAPLNVTFDARSSEDPSNDTIPSDNFYWYYTDTDGDEQTIGRGPVINYTFRDPGNHIVHLTIRSVNSRSEGVFDGETSLSINVAPKAADIILYIGGKRGVSKTSEIVKLGATNNEQGILLDATSTRPTGARTIQAHKRTIVNDSGYNFTKEGDEGPGEFYHTFPQNGIYTVQIDIQDNENNRVSEKFKVSISDPVAIVKQTPLVGSTSTEFAFDGSTSYAITSRIKTYQWVVTDPNGVQTDRIEGKEFRRKFLVPGMYTIRLTVIDEDGSQSYETRQVSVGSTPPVPSFIITPQSELKSPSQYIFDATASFDEDVRTGSDELSYQRLFSNNEYVTIQRALQDDNSIIKVSFEQPGTYKVKLIVEDSYGERKVIEKDLSVDSTLRPQLVISPQVGIWGDPVVFAAKANKPIGFYEWDFGDSEKQQSKTPKVEHSYKKAGIYKLKLRVVTPDGEENVLSRQVFMGQLDQPIIGYEVKNNGTTLLQPESSCQSGTGTVSAYEITRYQNIQIDAGLSRNAQGTRQDINISFHPKNDQIYKTSSLTYNFPEVGCTQVKLYVEDKNLGKTSVETIYFDIINALPQLDNLTISFPQSGGGSPIGVGTDTPDLSQQEIFSDPSVGSIVVRVKAKGARDPDGFISHYRRWYYPSEDPSRKEGFKITPSDVPYATFIVPKPPYATEYAFAVELIDNDDGRIRSEDVVGKGPIIFFPPGEGSLDIPIVTMKTSANTTRVGEEITFTTTANTLSDRPDFISSRYFKYDFDGDGEYDIPSTKQSTITHVYSEPTLQGFTYRPRVAVYYRGRAGIGSTEPITVLRGLKPRFEVNQSGKSILLEDFSLGEIINTVVCVDEIKCGTQLNTVGTGNSGLIYRELPFVHTYEDAGRYTIVMQVTDEYGNIQIVKQIVTIEDNSDHTLLSIPGVIPTDDGLELIVSDATDSTVSFYLPGERCSIDLNILVDSDVDGDPSLDQDVPCNELTTRQLFGNSGKQQGVIYQVKSIDGKRVIQETPLTIIFQEFMSDVPEEFKWAETEIDNLIDLFGIPEDDNQRYYIQSLLEIKNSLGERNEVNSVLIQLSELLDTSPELLTSEVRQKTLDLIESLGGDIVLESLGGSEYSTAKSNILGLLNEPYKQEAAELFQKFEQVQDNKEQAKIILDQIFSIAAKARDQGINDAVDFTYIQASLCDIIIYFELPSKSCGTLDNTGSNGSGDSVNIPSSSEKSTLIGTILKRVIGVVVVLAVGIGIMIVIFAVKARRRQQEDDEEE